MYAEVGNTVIFEKPLLRQLINDAVKIGMETAVKVARVEAMKDIELPVSKASRVLGVSSPTLIKYCNDGHRKAGKLPHKKEGEKYIVNRYDLEVFKERMK